MTACEVTHWWNTNPLPCCWCGSLNAFLSRKCVYSVGESYTCLAWEDRGVNGAGDIGCWPRHVFQLGAHGVPMACADV